jgi:hypothetical protein
VKGWRAGIGSPSECAREDAKGAKAREEERQTDTETRRQGDRETGRRAANSVLLFLRVLFAIFAASRSHSVCRKLMATSD